MYRKTLGLALCFFALPALAQILPWYRPFEDTDVILDNICLRAVATPEALAVGVTHDTAGLSISVMADNAAGETVYTSAVTDDINDIVTIGTVVQPSSGKINFKVQDNGCYQAHILDSIPATSGALSITVKIDDGQTIFGDYVNKLYLNFATLPDIGTTLDASLAIVNLDTLANELIAFRGTCDSGSTTTCDDALLTEADTNYWANGLSIKFRSGTVVNQTRCVTAFTPADDRITFAPVVTQAITTNTYVLMADASCVLNAAGLAADAVAEIADGVLDEDMTAHQNAGTLGQAIGDPVANTETMYDAVVTDATGLNVAVDVVALKSETVLILADTGELQGDDVPTLIAALPTAVENRTEIDSNSTQLTAIVADTDELQMDDVPGLIATAQADLNIITGATGVVLTAAGLDSDAVAEFWAETVAEPTGLPAWDTATALESIAYVMAWYRNEVQQTATLKTLRNDADSGDLITCGVSDSGTVFQVDECVTAP